MERQRALENFLGDKVTPLALGLYLWRGKYYEVLPYTLVLKRHNWSQFVRLQGDFRMREASLDIVKEYYPKVYQDIDFKKALELNPEIIKQK